MVDQQQLWAAKASESSATTAASSFYASVVSAGLAFHLGGFTLLLMTLPGPGGWSLLPETIYIDSLQALGFFALGAICRILTMAVLRSPSSASRVVLGDVGVVVLAFAVIAAIAVPLDTSGAGLFGIMMSLIWALPAAGLLSGLSFLVERYSWLRALLIVASLATAGRLCSSENGGGLSR